MILTYHQAKLELWRLLEQAIWKHCLPFFSTRYSWSYSIPVQKIKITSPASHALVCNQYWQTSSHYLLLTTPCKYYGEYTECNETTQKSMFARRFLEIAIHLPLDFWGCISQHVVAISDAKQTAAWSGGNIVLHSTANTKSIKCTIWSLFSYPMQSATHSHHHSNNDDPSTGGGGAVGTPTRVGAATVKPAEESCRMTWGGSTGNWGRKRGTLVRVIG